VLNQAFLFFIFFVFCVLNTITPHLTALLIAHALAIVALDHLADGRPLDAEAGRPLRPYVVEEAQLHGVD